MSENKDIINFIRQHGAKEFRPFAFYDKHLDCIRVRIKDCSVIEERVNKFFTLLKPTHAKAPAYVGFNIKGIRHLLDTCGLPTSGAVKIADIINVIVKFYPDYVAQQIKEEFLHLVDALNLQVEVEPVAA